MTESTVDLPADPDIKQLAHDVVRDGNEKAGPLIRDFCRVLSHLDRQNHLSRDALSEEDLESDIPPNVWNGFFNRMPEDVELVEGYHEFDFDAV